LSVWGISNCNCGNINVNGRCEKVGVHSIGSEFEGTFVSRVHSSIVARNILKCGSAARRLRIQSWSVRKACGDYETVSDVDRTKICTQRGESRAMEIDLDNIKF
jgi:hypothetical protein